MGPQAQRRRQASSAHTVFVLDINEAYIQVVRGTQGLGAKPTLPPLGTQTHLNTAQTPTGQNSAKAGKANTNCTTGDITVDTHLCAGGTA